MNKLRDRFNYSLINKYGFKDLHFFLMGINVSIYLFMYRIYQFFLKRKGRGSCTFRQYGRASTRIFKPKIYRWQSPKVREEFYYSRHNTTAIQYNYMQHKYNFNQYNKIIITQVLLQYNSDSVTFDFSSVTLSIMKILLQYFEQTYLVFCKTW